MQNSQSTLCVINCALADRAACCIIKTTTTMYVYTAATAAASIAARCVVVTTLLQFAHDSCKTCYTPRGRDIRRVSGRSSPPDEQVCILRRGTRAQAQEQPHWAAAYCCVYVCVC